jgi:hypothetical protein
LPPGLIVTSNNFDTAAETDLHLDFTATGLPDGAYDLVIYDPPHVVDAGAASIMDQRFGTVRGIAALRQVIEAGAREAWWVARVGVLVKVVDHLHQGEHLLLSGWVKAAIPMRLYTQLHTVRPSYLKDGKHRVTRVSRSNGAVYLTSRKDSHRHKDVDRLYERQQARVRKEAA